MWQHDWYQAGTSSNTGSILHVAICALLLEQNLAISCSSYYSKKRLSCSSKPLVEGSRMAERPCSNLSWFLLCWRPFFILEIKPTASCVPNTSWNALPVVVMSLRSLCYETVILSIPGVANLLSLY